MGLMDLITGAGGESHTLHTTPWAYRDDGGLYIGRNGQAWLYWVLPTAPIDPNFEDPPARLGLGRRLEILLTDLGSTSKVSPIGLASLSTNREVHILSLTWRTQARPPESATPRQAQFLEEALGFLVPTKALFVGVRLRAKGSTEEDKKLTSQLRRTLTSVLGESVPDPSVFDEDREAIESMLRRADGRPPTNEEYGQLESWYNLGRGPDALIEEHRNFIKVDDFDRLEFAALYRFNSRVNYAPNYQWIADMESHEFGAHCVSIRAELQPAEAARSRARASQRRIRSMIDEEAATRDVERREFSDTYSVAQAVEDEFIGSDKPLLTKASFIMARRVTDTDETYIDMLRSHHAIEVRPLDHRQILALDECLPCSSVRVNPFLQDVTVAMLAYAGVNGFSSLGDGDGIYIGITFPNNTPCYLDPLRSGGANKPPVCAIFGDPGSGKSFLGQNIATQAAFRGLPVVFINPKSGGIGSSLSGLVEYAGGRRVSLSELSSAAGAFDPFRFAPPEMAGEILADHIISALRHLDDGLQVRLRAWIGEEVKKGARCAKEALRGVRDEQLLRLIVDLVQGNALFALAFGSKPASPVAVNDGVTLIEFDRPLPLPDPNADTASYTIPERVALATITLVTRASVQMLANAGGGVLLVDEAWAFLNHPAGRAELERLGREGRSLNVLAVFMTQKVADILRHDLAGFLSRVFVMSLSDEVEANAALEIVELEPTARRRAWLRDAGPSRADPRTGKPAKWAMSVHRDLSGRRAAVLHGPTPDSAMRAWTTNPEDRRRAAQEAQDVTAGGH